MIDRNISVSEPVGRLSIDAALIYTWGMMHVADGGKLPSNYRSLQALLIPLLDWDKQSFKNAVDEIVIVENLWGAHPDNDLLIPTCGVKKKRAVGSRDTLFKKKSAELFEEFWKLYPNKKAKKKAKEIWVKIEPSGQFFHAIMKGLQSQVESKEWKKDGGAYVPHPTTWLNQERWNDEVNAAGEVKSKTDII